MKTIGIVGQGIAGTMLAWRLLQRGAGVIVFDNHHRHSSSMVAAGIINPVTGKRYALSWRFSAFYEAARAAYKQLESELGISVWQELDIVRQLGSPLEENNWASRCALPEFEPWLSTLPDAADWQHLAQPAFAWGCIRGAARADFATLLPAFRQKLEREGMLAADMADHSPLPARFATCDHVIFCEGYQASRNPWFAHLPWLHARGDVLIIRLKHPDAMQVRSFLKKNILLAPLGDGIFWAGANYAWDFEDDRPSASGKEFVLNELDALLHCAYEIVEHRAGVRPVLKDRRPVMGLLPGDTRIGIFNGLGAKGALLAPYWSAHFADHLLEGKELDETVSLSRFR